MSVHRPYVCNLCEAKLLSNSRFISSVGKQYRSFAQISFIIGFGSPGSVLLSQTDCDWYGFVQSRFDKRFIEQGCIPERRSRTFGYLLLARRLYPVYGGCHHRLGCEGVLVHCWAETRHLSIDGGRESVFANSARRQCLNVY